MLDVNLDVDLELTLALTLTLTLILTLTLDVRCIYQLIDNGYIQQYYDRGSWCTLISKVFDGFGELSRVGSVLADPIRLVILDNLLTRPVRFRNTSRSHPIRPARFCKPPDWTRPDPTRSAGRFVTRENTLFLLRLVSSVS